MMRIVYRMRLAGAMALGAVLLWTGHVCAEEKTVDITMSYEEYPRIDGSLACVPLCEALAVKATGCTQGQAEETMSDFTNTNPCYLELAKGNRDILLAYEPAEETKEELRQFAPVDMQPIGKDALVFIVNKDNPVESVTLDQIRAVFTGEIRNWKELGGEDEEIVAFRRPETSGSQTMLRKLLLGEGQMIDMRMESVPSMEGIIDMIRKYDNSANALGYSVYYYASAMYGQEDLKFLKIDGVGPDNDTIRSGEYPLVNPFYVVVNEQSSPNALRLRDWLRTEEGQAFVEECGYVGAGE